MDRFKNPQLQYRIKSPDTRSKTFCCSFCEKQFVDINCLFLHFENVHDINQAFRQSSEHSENSKPLNGVSTNNDSIDFMNKEDHPASNWHAGVSSQFLPHPEEQFPKVEVVSNSMLQYELMPKTNGDTQPAVSTFPVPRYFNTNIPRFAYNDTSITSEVSTDLCPIKTEIVEIGDVYPDILTHYKQSLQPDPLNPISTNGINQLAKMHASINASNVQFASSVSTSDDSIGEDYNTPKKRRLSESTASTSDEKSLLTTNIIPMSKTKVNETPVTIFNVLSQSTNELGYGVHNFMRVPSQLTTMTINNGVAFAALPTINSRTPVFSTTPPNNVILRPQSQPQPYNLDNSNFQADVQMMRNKPIPRSNPQYFPTANNLYEGINNQRAQPYNIRPQGSPHLYNSNTRINPGWHSNGQPIPQFDSRNVQLDVRMQTSNNALRNQSMDITFKPTSYHQMLLNPVFGLSSYQPNAPQQNNGSR